MFRRARELALGFLLCAGRRTVAGAIVARGRQHADWSADYRLFRKPRVRMREAFAAVRRKAAAELAPGEPFVAVLDDTIVRRRGRKVPESGWRRDPLGPPFAHQIAWAQRLVQACALVPDGAGGTRAIAVGLELLEASPRAPRNASREQLRETGRQRRAKGAPAVARAMVAALRSGLDGDGEAGRALLAALDGGYTNATVFRDIPHDTVLVGRVRGDAALFAVPSPTAVRGPGKPRLYGERLPKPCEMFADERMPWTTARAYAAGKVREFRCKTMEVRWKPTGGRTVRIIAVRALDAAHDTGRRLYFAHHAYLLCTDPTVPIERVLAAYVGRWEIEVAFREQKTEFGLGEPQARTRTATATTLQFQALLHGLVHLAARAAKPKALPLPAWRRPLRRLSFGQTLTIARSEAALDPPPQASPPNIRRLAKDGVRAPNPLIIKSQTENAYIYARW